MNCIREAENYLRHYRDLRHSVDHAEKMIRKFLNQGGPRRVSAVNMEVTGIHAANPVNTLNQIFQLQRWQEIRENTKDELEEINILLDAMADEPGCEQYKDVLLQWYVEKKERDLIADNLGQSRRNVYRLKEKALQKFSIMLFGIEALKAI